MRVCQVEALAVPRSASAGNAQPQRTDSLAALASCVDSSEAELRTLSADELTELVQEAEQGGARIGVLGRKRILAEAEAAAEGSKPAPGPEPASQPRNVVATHRLISTLHISALEILRCFTGIARSDSSYLR